MLSGVAAGKTVQLSHTEKDDTQHVEGEREGREGPQVDGWGDEISILIHQKHEQD